MRTLLLTIIATLALAGSAQAAGGDRVEIQPIDDLVEIQPIDPPVIDPPVIDPPTVKPPVIDPPTVKPPVIDPPVINPPRFDRLRLWLSPNSKVIRWRTISCRRPCRDARLITLAALPRPGQICLPRFFSPLRAGAYYRGKSIGYFSQADTCQIERWRKVAPVYQRHFR